MSLDRHQCSAPSRYPLTSVEVGNLDLLQALNRGLVPPHYLAPGYARSLEAYLVDYLKQEVFDEGLTRNVAAFSRFFEAVGYSHGDLTNYANIATDRGVDAKRAVAGHRSRSRSSPFRRSARGARRGFERLKKERVGLTSTPDRG